MPRRRIHISEDREVDAVDLDLSPQQGPDDFVVTAGECEAWFRGHADPDLPCHGRACPGHPRLDPRKAWMPGIKPGMTIG